MHLVVGYGLVWERTADSQRALPGSGPCTERCYSDALSLYTSSIPDVHQGLSSKSQTDAVEANAEQRQALGACGGRQGAFRVR